MAAGRWVVIGQHPNHETSVAVGTYHKIERAVTAADRLDRKGWVTEIVELQEPGEIGRMT